MMMVPVSHLDDMTIGQLIDFIFLVEQDKTLEELNQSLENGELLRVLPVGRERLRKLIEHYPDEEEERHLLSAELEAVHGFNPYSPDTLELKQKLLPIIQNLPQH